MKNGIRLSNGVEIPRIGFGTDRTFLFLRKNLIMGAVDAVKDITLRRGAQLKRDLSLARIVRSAPQYGCCLFDTASSYGQSERVLRSGLKAYDRSEYFLITKLSNREQREGDVKKALLRSMSRLGIQQLDLYLMHWPQTGTYVDCWKQMEDLYDAGLTRAIGVCNFKVHHFETLLGNARINPMICQIESHPLFSQEDMLSFCKQNNIQMMAYTPTGRMDEQLRNSPILKDIATVHGKDVAQVILRWHVQRGVIPIVNTTKIEHLSQNMDIWDFCLTETEMEKIGEMNENRRLRYDPDMVDFTKC